MLDLLTSLAVLTFFAWLARALLAARDMSWSRTLLAAIAGLAVGDLVAFGLLVSDFRQIDDLDMAAFRSIALPFQVILTMAAVVVLELVRPSRRRRRGLRVPHPWRVLRRWMATMSRGWEVMRIMASHGLAPLVGLRHGHVSTRSPEELSRRIRAALEDAGGMFVKLGQLLATRPDLLPPAVLAELERLHATVKPLDRTDVERIISEETGSTVDELFASFDWDPLGSASIAQAHAARLVDGLDVVVKVQRPGLEELVERDSRIALWQARLAARRTEWGRSYGVVGLVEEFIEKLRTELDFTVEARNATDVAESLSEHAEVTAPRIVDHLTSGRMLVMERLDGLPLATATASGAVQNRRSMADALCRSQVTAMLQGERFHGDPHPGNILLLDDGRIGLIDFGITDRLDAFEQASVFQMLVALKLEHPILLYEAMLSIGAVDVSHDPEEIERAFAGFMSSHLRPGLPSPEALTDLLRLTTELRLRLPQSTSTMFRALATLAGTLERMSPDYPLIDVVAEIGGDELSQRTAPTSVRQLIEKEWAGLAPLLSRAPRHLDRLATIAAQGRLATRVRMFDRPGELSGLERLVNRTLLTFLSIGVAAVSVMMITAEAGPTLAATDTPLLAVWGWAGLFVAVVLLLRVLLAIFRAEKPD